MIAKLVLCFSLLIASSVYSQPKFEFVVRNSWQGGTFTLWQEEQKYFLSKEQIKKEISKKSFEALLAETKKWSKSPLPPDCHRSYISVTEVRLDRPQNETRVSCLPQGQGKISAQSASAREVYRSLVLLSTSAIGPKKSK